MGLLRRRLGPEAIIDGHEFGQPLASGGATVSFHPAGHVLGSAQIRVAAEGRALGVEGLMLKQRESAYGVGRQRGAWWKWKIDPLRIDAVLVYAQAGSGHRANLFADYTFAVWQDDALVPIATAYSGLSDRDILALDRWIRRNTVERFGPVRRVVPEQVFELAFEGISRSSRHKSGLALRFPRIARWRTDKPASQADRLAQVRALLPDGIPGGQP